MAILTMVICFVFRMYVSTPNPQSKRVLFLCWAFPIVACPWCPEVLAPVAGPSSLPLMGVTRWSLLPLLSVGNRFLLQLSDTRGGKSLCPPLPLFLLLPDALVPTGWDQALLCVGWGLLLILLMTMSPGKSLGPPYLCPSCSQGTEEVKRWEEKVSPSWLWGLLGRA